MSNKKKNFDFDALKMELNNGVVAPTIYNGGFPSKEEAEYTRKLLILTQDPAVFALVNEMLDEAYHNGRYYGNEL